VDSAHTWGLKKPNGAGVSIGLLTCDEHDVAEAVGVKLRHRSEVCGEDFTVTRPTFF
jgi:hypothetical protein